jgi:hypothetical protein
MSITSELTKSLEKAQAGFLERAIAREIDAMLHDQTPMGKITINASTWSLDWGVDQAKIWAVIEALVATGFWQTLSGMTGELLICSTIADSAKSIGKVRKKASMGAVKQKSSEQRANNMSLSDANLAERSKMAEVVEQMPFEQRFDSLRRGFDGWLPSDRYSAAGMVFRPDGAMIEKLGEQFPSIDMALALATMYEDLRECPHDRPSIAAFVYWMPNWLKKNTARLTTALQGEQHSKQLPTLLDDY